MSLEKYDGLNSYDNYMKNEFMAYFNKINTNKIKLADKELKKIELVICSGRKYHDLLYLSLNKNYFNDEKIHILNIVMENQCISEKFFLRIMGILQIFKKKHCNYNINFDWVLFLKKNGFEFNDDHIKLLKDIGFKINLDNLDLDDKTMDSFLNISSILSFIEIPGKDNAIIKIMNEKINKLTNYFKNNKIVLNKEILSRLYKELYECYDKIYYQFYSFKKVNKKLKDLLDEFIDNLYKIQLENNYEIQDYDFYLFIDNYSLISDLLSENDNSKENLIEKSKFFMNKIKTFNNEFIEKYLENVYHNPEADNNIIEKLDLLDIMISNFLINNKNKNINILKYLIIDDEKYINDKETFLNKRIKLFDKIYDSKIDNFDEELLYYAIESYDENLLEYMFEKNIMEINQDIFNSACRKCLDDFIIKMLHSKYIPNINNLKNCNNIGTAKILIEQGGLYVNDEVLKYFIENFSSYIDLDKYDYNTPEKIELVKNICYECDSFPYENIKPDNKIVNLIQEFSVRYSNYDNKYIITKFFKEKINIFNNLSKQKYLLKKLTKLYGDDEFVVIYLKKLFNL
jgi:hypothetical protein